jgi:NapC/NirT cytochrome c family, N-terminal region
MRRWPIVIGVLVIVLGVVVAMGLQYTSQPSFCASCHGVKPFADSWVDSSHAQKGVTCIDCHFEPGALGYIKGKTYSMIKLAEWALGKTDIKPEATKTVVVGACRHCHENPQATFIPHFYHTDTANLACVECHSAVVHGAKLVGEERPQAKADPAFCGKCHTGDIAPILFGPITPAGREHPGAPKIDVDVWKNIHWRMARGAAVIDGVPYDQIEPLTCAACHKDPTQAKACKSCHSARIPEFRPSTAAQMASILPIAIFGLLFVLLILTVVLTHKDKRTLFTSRWMQAVVGLVALSDVYIVYLIIRDTLVKESGSSEIGPTTVYIAYLLVSIAIVLLLVYESIVLPGRPRVILLPKTDEEEIYVPDHNIWLKRPEASTLVDDDYDETDGHDH